LNFHRTSLAVPLTVNNVISGSGSVVKSAVQELSLTGDNSYSGGTVVSGGTLFVNNTTGSGTGSGAVTVATSATLGGTGSIDGDVTIDSGGTLAAGESIGTLTINGAATNNGTIVAEIANGPSADKIVFNGGAELGGTLTVVANGDLTSGQSFDLFDGTLSGTFTTVNLPGNPSHWNTDDLYAGGTITLNNNAPVAGDFDLGVAVGGSTEVSVVGKYVSDADVGDTVTITLVSTPANGTISIVGGTNLVYTSTNSATSDSFTYTVSDGLTSDTGAVTVSIGAAEGFNQLSVSVLGGGDVELTYLGIPGENYALEWTHDLTPPITWDSIVTKAAAGNGYLIFTNTPSGGNDFYRTTHIP